MRYFAHTIYNVQAPCLIADIELFYMSSLNNSADIYLTLDKTMDVCVYIYVPSFFLNTAFGPVHLQLTQII